MLYYRYIILSTNFAILSTRETFISLGLKDTSTNLTLLQYLRVRNAYVYDRHTRNNSSKWLYKYSINENVCLYYLRGYKYLPA